MFRDFQRRPRAVERGDGVAFSCEVQRESALVAENIKRAAMGVTLSGGIVLALVKKCSGLLAAEAIVVKPNPVDGIDGRGLLAPQQPAWRWRKLFQLANPRIYTLHYAAHCLGRKLLEQFGDRHFLNVSAIHGLGQGLQREDLAIAIHNESRQSVGLTEDQPIRLGIRRNQAAPVGNSFAHALAQ